MTTIREALRRMLSGDHQTSPAGENQSLKQAISLVLHEHSESAAVRAAAADAQRHAETWSDPVETPSIVDFTEIPPSDVWLTANTGCHAVVRKLAAEHSSQPTVTFIDHRSSTDSKVNFFRAPASLNLPRPNQNVTVVAAVVRPGGSDVVIFWEGPFRWPEQEDAALRALERLIQAHVGQWLPASNPWDGGAEDVLPAGEIMDV